MHWKPRLKFRVLGLLGDLLWTVTVQGGPPLGQSPPHVLPSLAPPHQGRMSCLQVWAHQHTSAPSTFPSGRSHTHTHTAVHAHCCVLLCVCVCSPPGDWLRTVWVDYPGAPGTKVPSRRWGGAGCDPHSHLPSPLAHTWCSPCLEGGLWVEASQALWNLGAEQGPLLGLKVALTLWPSFHPSFLPLTCPYFPLASSSDSFTPCGCQPRPHCQV